MCFNPGAEPWAGFRAPIAIGWESVHRRGPGSYSERGARGAGYELSEAEVVNGVLVVRAIGARSSAPVMGTDPEVRVLS